MPIGKIGTQYKRKQNTSEWSVEDATNFFLQDGEVRGLSPATITHYKNILVDFRKYFNGAAADINKEVINGWIMEMRNRGNKDVTINTNLRGIRTFIKWIAAEGVIESFEIATYKFDKPVKEIYTDEELDKLLQEPELPCSFTEYRCWTIVNFLLATGVRAGTLINIKIQDLDLDRRKLQLTKTKTRINYTLPISSTLAAILEDYLVYREGDPEDYLFCTRDGQQMTVDGLGNSIDRYNKSRGVKRRGIHLFRHTFASKAVEAHIDVYRLSKLLGHTTIEMSKNYVAQKSIAIDNIDSFSYIDSRQSHRKLPRAKIK